MDGLAVGAAALRRDRNRRGAGKIPAGERSGVCGDVRGPALRDEMTAGMARAGTQIHDEVGAADGFLVVLDDEDGVAEVAELLEGASSRRSLSRAWSPMEGSSRT